jgi:hypothetical protein
MCVPAFAAAGRDCDLDEHGLVIWDLQILGQQDSALHVVRRRRCYACIGY